MKNLLYILLFSTSAFSQNYYYAIGEKQSQIVPEPTVEEGNNESEPTLEERNTENLILVETFENPNLENNPQDSDFYLEHAEDHNFNVVKNIKRKGSTAGRFEINKDDPLIWGGNRTEMSQAQSTSQKEGWYGFSQFFPDTYTSGSTGEVIGQWHVQPDDGETTNRSPSNALIASDDKLKWMLRWDADRIMEDGFSDGHIYIELGEIPKNRWIDWVVHIKYSHTNTGILEVWMDGKKIIDRQNMPNAYNDGAYPYFKFGVYKWEWGAASSKRVIYYDEVRIGDENSSYDEVKPGGY